MPIPLYSIQDLFVSKGNEDILSIKQFDIHRGACYVFEGRMGSGKTTLLETLYKRNKTQRGEICLRKKISINIQIRNIRIKLPLSRKFLIHPGVLSEII